MKNVLIAAAMVVTMLTGTAFAADAKRGTPQNHVCCKDGAVQEGKTHKACTKVGEGVQGEGRRGRRAEA